MWACDYAVLCFDALFVYIPTMPSQILDAILGRSCIIASSFDWFIPSCAYVRSYAFVPMHTFERECACTTTNLCTYVRTFVRTYLRTWAQARDVELVRPNWRIATQVHSRKSQTLALRTCAEFTCSRSWGRLRSSSCHDSTAACVQGVTTRHACAKRDSTDARMCKASRP